MFWNIKKAGDFLISVACPIPFFMKIKKLTSQQLSVTSSLKSCFPKTQQIRILQVVLNRVLSNYGERMSDFERGNFKNSVGHSLHLPTPQYCERITFISDFHRIFLSGIPYNYDLQSLLPRVNTSNDFNFIS